MRTDVISDIPFSSFKKVLLLFCYGHHEFEKSFPVLHMSTEMMGGKTNLKQYNIRLDAAYNTKYSWLAMRKVAEAAKCLLILILWVTA